MQDLLELLVQIRTSGLDGLDKIQTSLKNTSTAAQTGSGDFAEFEKRLQNFTKSGLTLREALEQVAGQSKGAGGAFRQMAVDALEADKSFQLGAKNAEKLADQHEKTTARIIASLERRAAATDRFARLESERSSILGITGNNPRVNTAFDTIIRNEEARAAARIRATTERVAASEASALSRLATLGAGYAGGIPTFAGRGAFAAGLAGPLIGLSGAALAIGTVRSAAQDSRETVNSANRLDLSVGQTRELQNEARLAGVSFGSLENAQRTLSAALEDGSGTGKKAAEVLSKLGINAVTSTGEVRSMGPVLLDVIDKLADLPNKTERAAEGNRILGRGYKEIEPLIEKHRELQGELSKYGLILDSNLITKLSEAETKFNALGIAFDNLKAKVADGLAPIVIPIVVSLTDPFGVFKGKPAYTIAGGPGEGAVGAFFDNLTGESRGAARAFAETQSNTPSNPARDVVLGFVTAQTNAQNANARAGFGKFLGNQGDSEADLRKRTNDAKEAYLAELEIGKRLERSSGINSAAFEKETEKITGLKTAYDGLNSSLKAFEERKKAPESNRRFIESLQEKDEDGIQKVFTELDRHLRSNPTFTRSERGDAADAVRDRANALIAEARDKEYDEASKQDNKLQRRSERNLDSPILIDALKGLERWDKDIVAMVKKGDQSSEEIGRINRQSDREQTSAQSSRVLRNFELNAGPGTNGQKQAADEAYAYRIAKAEEFERRESALAEKSKNALVDGVEVEAQHKKLLWEAENEHETKLLETQHKRQQEAEAFAGKLFDSLQKPGGFQQFVKGELTGLERQVFTNVTGPILGSVGKSVSSLMPQGGAWSSVFKGTILDGTGGKDTPVVAAADRTTAAVNEVRDTIAAAATGKPLPGGNSAGVGAAASSSAVPGSSTAASSLMTWLGLGGLAAASINTIVNPPGFPGKKEIDTPGGATNGATVSHGYQDSAHTGAASRIFAGSVGLAGSVIGSLTKIGQGRNAVYVDPSGNVVSGSGEGGAETYGTPSDGSFGDFGGEVSSGGGGNSPVSGGSAPSVSGGPAAATVAGSYSTANSPSTWNSMLSSFKGSVATPGGPFSSQALGNLVDAFAGGTAGQKTGAALGEGMAIAGPVAAGVTEAIKQFSNGGVRGALGGAGAIIGTAAALDPEPISKAVLGASAMVLGIVKAILPDPKTVRAQQESEALTQNAYLAPPTINSTQSVNGQNVSYDKFGRAVTTGQFSGFNVNQPYEIKDQFTGNYDTVPGSVTNITPGSASRQPGSVGNAGSASPGTPQVTIHIAAMDAQSIMDRSPEIGAAVYAELSKGGALASRVSSVVLGS